MEKHYVPTWNSVRQHLTPAWFQEAKFGIYTHWGVYCVPGRGPNATWYPYNMYRPGTAQYEYHVKTYGDPSRFGYKDFIPFLTGEKFDPDEWAEMFRKAGARFAGPVGEHHDGFCMWDTRYSEWKATLLGPKRNVVGELEKAVRAQGMKFMVALHHAENWWFFPHWVRDYDTADPRYAGLYGEPHNLDGRVGKNFFEQDTPSRAFQERWRNKVYEVIDDYRPDMLWFDFGIRGIHEHYRREVLSYFYNKEQEWGKEVVLTFKHYDMAPLSGVVDLELGRFSDLTYHDWITDTTVDAGEGWGYLRETGYKSTSSLIHYLVDNVSKNGYLLLNVGPKPDGSIPEEAQEVLKGMGKWLDTNGEAIYGTTCWWIYGEGPTKMVRSGPFSEEAEVVYQAEDIRFTVKDNNLYATCLGIPKEEIHMHALKVLYPGEIVSINMLGDERKLPWTLDGDGLHIQLPAEKPCEHALVFKIIRKEPF